MTKQKQETRVDPLVCAMPIALRFFIRISSFEFPRRAYVLILSNNKADTGPKMKIGMNDIIAGQVATQPSGGFGGELLA